MSGLMLQDIRALALTFVPRVACRVGFVHPRAPGWGPSHEIGHALVATPEERALPAFGLGCYPGCCRCPKERCHVAELAAMLVSAGLLRRAGRDDLVRAEVRATDGFDEIALTVNVRAAERLLVERRLQRLPRTRAGLERLLARRLSP
jgi:hypothetical protein